MAGRTNPGRETRTFLIRTNSRLAGAYAQVFFGAIKTAFALVLGTFDTGSEGVSYLWLAERGIAFWASIDLVKALGYWYWWRSGVNVLDDRYEPGWILDRIFERLRGFLDWGSRNLTNRLVSSALLLIFGTVALLIAFVPLGLWYIAKDKAPMSFDEKMRLLREREEEDRRRRVLWECMAFVGSILVALVALRMVLDAFFPGWTVLTGGLIR